MRIAPVAALSLAALLLAGCAQYYKVTDPTTGKVYYTTDLHEMRNGAATLKDARTGNRVHLQNTEVEQINQEQFESGKNTPPSAMTR